jgi:putative tryptophan/tyrosine transport system substrate-binding protein
MSVSRLRLERRAVLTAVAVLALAGVMRTAGAAEQMFVAVTAIVEHPALEACRDGIRDALKDAGYEDGKNLKLIYENAGGNLATAVKIADRFARDKPSVIVPISTPSARTVVAATIDVPVVFTAVTDPLGANLVRDMDRPGGNVTGVSDLAPVTKQIELIKQITPLARKIGVLFNPHEMNSYTIVRLMKTTAMGVNMTIVEAPAPKSSDVQAAAKSLVGKADVIFVPTDNTIVSMLDFVIKVGVENRIPVYAGDIDAVKSGAIAAIGFDYYSVGWQTGNIVVRILKGERAGTIPVEVVEETRLYVNTAAAAKMGVTIPEHVISQADKVIK